MKKNKKAILEFFAKGDHKGLQEHIMTALGRAREKSVSQYAEILPQVDGKVRLKILEILMIDGGADLITLFMDAIRNEKNLLYAKSQILLFREFKHQEALGALLSLEEHIDKDLRGTYQRALGKLLSQFSEQFYMSEFLAGRGNRRRVKFAVDMMLRSPHPEYLPFFEEQVMVNDMGFRFEALRALEQLGQERSVEIMFDLLTRLRSQKHKADQMMKILTRSLWEPGSLFDDLVEKGGVNRTADQIFGMKERMKASEVRDVLGQVLDDYDLTLQLAEKSRIFFAEVFSGKNPNQFDISRIQGLVKEYQQELAELMQNLGRVLGLMAVKAGDEDFLRKMENWLPLDDPDRDRVLIASLAGYQCPESYDLLLEYVNTCAEPDLLKVSLDALEEYHAEEVPSGVEKLCFDENAGPLRRQALDLVAQWGHGEEIINRLLQNEGLSARADGIRTVAEYRLLGCYPSLLKLLQPGVPDSLLITALEGLRAFDEPQTGRAVKPYLIPPHTLSIRKAALETLFRAGGPERLELILKTFETNNIQQMTDLLEYFLELILEGNFEEIQVGLVHHRDFWLRLIPEVSGDLKTKLISLIERLEIEEEVMARTWADGLDKLLAQFRGKTVSDDERRLSAVAERLKQQVALWKESTTRIKIMSGIMEGLESRNNYQQVQSLRKLSQDYRPVMAQEQPANFRKLLGRIQEYLTDTSTPAEVMLQAIAVAGSLRHPQLFKMLEKMKNYPNVSIRNAAAAALTNPVDASFFKVIQSVFIMDDSRYITKQLARVLAEAGLEVDFENDVMEGMAQLEEKSYDLLILDLVMPGMDGMTFLKKARKSEIAPDHVLIITSTRNHEELQPILRTGVSGMLLKPFRMEDMIKRIKSLGHETPTL